MSEKDLVDDSRGNAITMLKISGRRAMLSSTIAGRCGQWHRPESNTTRRGVEECEWTVVRRFLLYVRRMIDGVGEKVDKAQNISRHMWQNTGRDFEREKCY
jgi:hypothetical protein